MLCYKVDSIDFASLVFVFLEILCVFLQYHLYSTLPISMKSGKTTHNIIDSVIPQARSRELVRIAIPVLVRWAKLGLTDKTYGDLIKEVWHTNTSSYIGSLLGNIEVVMRELRNITGKQDIPSLNALCKKPKVGIPSDGFDFVYPNYSKLSLPEKRVFVAGINNKAVEYKHWDWVLNELDLKPAVIFTDEELLGISKPIYGGGGEGKEHKALKEYVAAHPETIGIKGVLAFDTEHVLPSGDRLDVYFELKNGERIAVEVKPSSSPDEDVSRGIFQCVKYKAVMEAVKTITYSNYEIKTLLVCGGLMSNQNKQLAEDLGAPYIDNYHI